MTRSKLGVTSSSMCKAFSGMLRIACCGVAAVMLLWPGSAFSQDVPQCIVPAGARIVVSDLSDGVTAADLATALVGSGVSISNLTYTGAPIAAGTFVDQDSVSGIPTGVILGSGCNKAVAGPNDSGGTSYELGTPGDADLNGLIPGFTTLDATVLEFDFVPTTDRLQIRYVFGSEEYNEWVNSSFNDVFGLFVNGVNKALLPDNLTVVAINNVNGGNPFGTAATNPAFYRNNDCADGGCTLDIEADGLTLQIVLTANVVPDQPNHFKVAIADAGDQALDSWILMESGSFHAAENCTNQVDDNDNGLIDNADPDCWLCGDGNMDPGEECDDGNIDHNDGCDPLCVLEDSSTTTTTTTLPPDTTTTTLPPTTTTTLPATGACCTASGCFVTTSAQCEVGGYQGDGTSCDAPGMCVACGNGLVELGEQCDDAGTAAGDGCDAKCSVEQCWACTAEPVTTTIPGPGYPIRLGPSVCSHDDGGSCDDGDLCTVGDTCGGGTCDGDEVAIPAACRWVMTGASGVQSRTRGQSAVTGHICGGRVRIGEFTTTNGDAVATLAAGVGIQISSHAEVSGDIVTGGSSVRGKPRLVLLPGLATDVVAGGSTAVQSANPSWIYDTLGTNTRVADCAEAQGNLISGDSLLTGMPPGPDLGDTFIAQSGALTLTATNPGALNVFDFTRLRSLRDATLTLDAAGNAGSVFVVRVKKKLDLRLRSKVVLTGGALPGNVILYSQAKCRFGEEVTGVGTVFCPNGKLILEERTQWQGALVGGRGRVELRDSGILIHAPLQVGQ